MIIRLAKSMEVMDPEFVADRNELIEQMVLFLSKSMYFVYTLKAFCPAEIFQLLITVTSKTIA